MQLSFEEDALILIAGTGQLPERVKHKVTGIDDPKLLQRLEKGLLTFLHIISPDFDAILYLAKVAKKNFVPFHVLGKVDRNNPDKVINFKVRKKLRRQGVKNVYLTDDLKEWNALSFRLKRMRTRMCNEHGPFDFIGDIHGCYEELNALLDKLGYVTTDAIKNSTLQKKYFHPDKRKLVFLGDMVDRGPASDKVMELILELNDQNIAYAVLGNHDEKFLRYLKGNPVRVNSGLERTIRQFERKSEAFKNNVIRFLKVLPSHYVLDDGRIIAVHAGIREDMQGKDKREIKDYCVFGEPGETKKDDGLPVRQDWGRDYNGKAKVVYGHTPVKEPFWINNSIDIDSGCVFGGKLTALRYPEMELISVNAFDTYSSGVDFVDFRKEWNLKD
ncbi:metallophosphoesterase [Sporocytophaga myxococcoides]|uniref:Metallophosphoesterase n=1 Tax=Sporocytophaga myxococcoides TaxID=153721 RepID=A0A098L8A6_9BACT|nr:metallophosphoesterase [Sporocytophaga myxococcoides]GAL82895.1 metallophosphoesterase [Sporocytophaga myxococcoides]